MENKSSESLNNLWKVNLIKERRSNCKLKDTPELKQRRKKFLDFLMGRNFIHDIQVFEMYPTVADPIKSKKTIPQYPDEYTYANTRLKTNSETRAEIDKLDFEKSIKVIIEICLSLIKNEYHFAVFYSEGQRSPHIIIYDLFELETLHPFKRELAQEQFWRKISPFSIQWLDMGVNCDNHPVPIEFSIHWKTGEPFDLLFEYVPGGEKCKV